MIERSKREDMILSILEMIYKRDKRFSEDTLFEKIMYGGSFKLSDGQAKIIYNYLKKWRYIEKEKEYINLLDKGIEFIRDAHFKNRQLSIQEEQTKILKHTKIVYIVLAILAFLSLVITFISVRCQLSGSS
ncbi:hypothetical protein HYU13_04280 [Candidatus Woesearchaeota archaeon]|nr:hypothetical protein [Candidatus Woesearchaeota archaeon]